MKFLLGIALFLSTIGSAGQMPIWQIQFIDGWGTERLILLTGFGPFGDVTDNPSGRIVRPLKEEIERRCASGGGEVKGAVLPVVPGIIEQYSPTNYETVVSIGVSAGSPHIRMETSARNFYYDPYTGESRRIDPTRPETTILKGPPIPETIPDLLEGFAIVRGDLKSAGTYVCNDTYYRLCQHWSSAHKTRGFFVHIPNTPKSEDGRLARALGEMTCRMFD